MAIYFMLPSLRSHYPNAASGENVATQSMHSLAVLEEVGREISQNANVISLQKQVDNGLVTRDF